MSSIQSPSSSDITSTLNEAAQSIISGSTNSALDVDQLVKALVNAKVAGPSATLATRQNSDNTTLSAIGKMKSALAALQTALGTLKDGSALKRFTATGDKDKGLTATASTLAVAGTYKIEVKQLATAHKLTSDGVEANEKLGTGTLKVSVGAQSMNIAVDGKNNSLAGIAAAINGAKDNPGVTATIVTGKDGQHLVVSSNKTGKANEVTLSTAGTLDSRLDSTNMHEATPAQDAQALIDGTEVTSASNTLDNAISGLSIRLDSAAENTTQTLTVAPDTDATAGTIRDFVAAYNSFVTTMNSLTSYDPKAAAGSRAGPLLGDSMAQTLKGGLAGIVAGGAAVGGKNYSLLSLGIKLQGDGTLTIDDDKFKAAVKNGDASLKALFNPDTGVAARLDKAITPYAQSSGLIDKRTDAINKDLDGIKKQQDSLQLRITALTKQYNAQFTALNSLMATMNSNQAYLTQLFGGQNSAGALATNHK